VLPPVTLSHLQVNPGKDTGLLDNPEMSAKSSGPGDRGSDTRKTEHQTLHAGLLEGVIGGKCLGGLAPLHNDASAK
jgi:hypothetical protein